MTPGIPDPRGTSPGRKPVDVRTLAISRFSHDELANALSCNKLFHWDYDRYYVPSSLDSVSLKPGDRGGIWLQFFTYCNNRCLYCPDPYVQTGRLDLESAIHNLDLLATKGIRHITLSGGEPTLQRNLSHFVARLRESGYVSIAIATNARRLARKDYCQRLLDAGVTMFFVSLHGWNDESGGFLTGRSRSFQETMSGLNAIRKHADPSTTIRVNHVVTSLSADKLDRIAEIAIQAEVRSCQFSMLEQFVKNRFIEDLIPDLDRLREGLGRALPTLLDAGIRPVIEGVAPCLYVGYEPYYFDYHRVSDEHLRVNYKPQLERDLILINRGTVRNIAHTYGPQCDDCDYRPACSGMYYTVFRKYRNGQLVPVRLSKEQRRQLMARRKPPEAGASWHEGDGHHGEAIVKASGAEGTQCGK